MNSKKNQARQGHRGCWCCYDRISTKAMRQREKKEWKREQ